MNNEIQPGQWIDSYHFWISKKGPPTKVKPIKFIGLRGWNNYIYKKEHEGTTYCGEIWECEDIFGDIFERTFRTVYSDEIEESKYKFRFKKTYDYRDTGDVLHQPDVNAHTDGLEAFLSNDYSKRHNFLLEHQNNRLKVKIAFLNDWFANTNNLENKLLRLGIHLYLRRLQTPTMQTSREWKEYRTEHPYLTAQIVNRLKEIGIMT